MRIKAHISWLIILSCLVYANTLNNTFHLDDYYRVLNNPGTQKVWPVTRHFTDPTTMSSLPRLQRFRPMLPLTLSLNFAIGKHSRFGYHLVNLGLHTLASIIVYFLCLELLRQTIREEKQFKKHGSLALMVAGLFLIHPISGIPVNYISARDLIMMQVFLTSSLLCYLRMRRLGTSKKRWVGVLFFFGLALLSKKNVIVFPALILVYELTILRGKLTDPKTWVWAFPFAAMVFGLFIYLKYVLEFSEPVYWHINPSFWTYPIAQLKLHLLNYGFHFIWPLGIRQGQYVAPTNFTDSGPLLGLIFIMGTLYIAWRVRRNQPLISFCILAYWVMIAPDSSIFPLNNVAVDYRPYSSSPFLYLALGTIAFSKVKPRVLIPSFLALIIYFSATSIYLNSTWKTGESLWGYSVAKGGSALAHLNYAMHVKDLGKRERLLRKALEMEPEYILARMNLGLLLIKKGNTKEGLKLVEIAAAQDPGRAQSQYWLAQAYKANKKPEDALKAAMAATRLQPSNLKYQYEAASQMQGVGKYENSIPILKSILAKDPNFGRTSFLLNLAQQMGERLSKTISVYKKQIDLHPNDYEARFKLGNILMKQGRFNEAILNFQKTLNLKPDYTLAHKGLAICYKAIGDINASQQHFAMWSARIK